MEEAAGRCLSANCRDYGWSPDAQWATLPNGWNWIEVAAVAVDRHDRVHVFNRGDHPMIVFDRNGTFLHSWGEGLFVRPHGLFISPDDTVWCTDDLGHAVHQFTLEGKPLLTLGTPGKPSDTGATSIDFRTIRRASSPFHYPTNLAVAPNGDLYISDGYGNARVHRFAPNGQLVMSWGEPGVGPGQFRVPHGIAIDKQGTVYVADRENSRIQLFGLNGEFLGEWRDVARPSQIFIDAADNVFVAELGFRAGMWPGTSPPPGIDPTGGRVSIYDRHGKVRARWGGGDDPCAAGDFFAPHGIWVDSRGDIYVAEVVMSAGGKTGMVPPTCHSLQKFIFEIAPNRPSQETSQ